MVLTSVLGHVMELEFVEERSYVGGRRRLWGRMENASLTSFRGNAPAVRVCVCSYEARRRWSLAGLDKLFTAAVKPVARRNPEVVDNLIQAARGCDVRTVATTTPTPRHTADSPALPPCDPVPSSGLCCGWTAIGRASTSRTRCWTW